MVQRETVETKIASRRIINVVAIFFLFYAATLFFVLKNSLLFDEIIITSVMDFTILGILFICLLRRRAAGLQRNPADTYSTLTLVIALCWGLLIISSWLPECFVPMAGIVFLLTSVLDEVGTISLSIYFCLAYAMFESKNIHILYEFMFCVIVNALLADYMKKNQDRYKVLILVLVGVVNTFLPLGFSYLAYHVISLKLVIFCLLHVVITLFIVIFVFPYLILMDEEAKWTAYEDILLDTYPLVADIRGHSELEYLHGRLVSKLAAKCAHEIGASDLLAACGGLYYRLNVFVGGRRIEDRIDNAIGLASEHCFPPDVIEIIGEFEGKKRLPQSRESAIVHMVNGLVTKIELLEREVGSSDWNQDMLIYQTLNDFSNAGIYDESNLSMNQFLKVRELLVREGIVR